LPPPGFASRALSLVDVARGAAWRRLYQSRFPNPLGYGFSPSRFSDPATTLVPPERFGVVYFGSSIKVCFVEAILRDRGVARTHAFPIEWAELEAWSCAEVRVEWSICAAMVSFGWEFRPMSLAQARKILPEFGLGRLGRTTRNLTVSCMIHGSTAKRTLLSSTGLCRSL
jgi:hypothetical protein